MKSFSPTRRRFVLGAASAGAMVALGGTRLAFAQAPTAMDKFGPQTLTGTKFDLAIGQQKVNLTGHKRWATTVNGSLPAPILRWKEGTRVSLDVANHLAHDSSIHWHGIILPTAMDGVPGLSFDGIKPGQSHHYEFDVNQSGTYWYHSHSGFQEQTGLYGAIIIEPKGGYPFTFDREYVVQLSDWSDEDPKHIYAKLKKQSDYYNFQERTTADLMHDIGEYGVKSTWSRRKMWNQMRMSDRDISDVTGYTYTFLMNGVTPDNGWVGTFKRGEKILLRVINSSAMTIFDVRIPGLKMTVVAADGQYVQPVSIDEFRIGVAETYDVLVEPQMDMPYTVFAQAIDRTGYARGTLTSDPARLGQIPAMDPTPILTHTDMGMNMNMGGMNMGDMDHSGHDSGSSDQGGDMNGMNMDSDNDDSSSSDHSGHNMNMSNNMSGMGNMGGMDMGGDSNNTMSNKPKMGSGKAGYGSSTPIQHAPSEHGPQVDMRAMDPQYRLDDPGIGLRDHMQKYGRKVLTYADLRGLHMTRDKRQPSREIILHLTGNMSRYQWSINGIKFADAEPLKLKYGERVRITLVNDTMMNHPIHLHGMWSELETGDGMYIPRKHTILVQPGSKISYLVTADAKGRWAYHCHLLYHMLGMFREVQVS